MTYNLITSQFMWNNHVQSYCKFNLNTINMKNDLIIFKPNFNPTNYLNPSKRFSMKSLNFKSIRDKKKLDLLNYDLIWKIIILGIVKD